MDLSVITVTYNSKQYITKQIRSVISGCKHITFEHIIIDNASIDGTEKEVEKWPSVQFVKQTENVGFAAANNKAAEIAKGSFLLFLNPDMIVQPESLDTLVQWMKDHPETGIASCRLVDSDGQLNEDARPRRFPTVWNQLAVLFKLPHVLPATVNTYLYTDRDFSQEQEVDTVRGSFFLMRRDIVSALGWAFDPRYIMWFEDVDTCREVWKRGWKVIFTPIITCVDHVGGSFRQRSPYVNQKQFTKSMLTYFQKWEPWYVWMWIAVARPIGLGLSFLYSTVKKK
ncbi:MAG TPA: glycosyltransferase family 2 protein [Candidatus Kapabacteria bacterium]|nr:glycosyltransferase family 2 protein [Candidatus Kapabacteria bacterium]